MLLLHLILQLHVYVYMLKINGDVFQALNWLTVWAVLMNRHKLAKVLWNRCDEPIALALICSNLYKELAKNCMELFLRTEMERNAK